MEAKLFSNRDLRRLIIPIIIEFALDISVGIVDSVMVSNAGAAAVSGISLVNEFNRLPTSILAAFATGGMILVAQYLGAGKTETTNRLSKQVIWLNGLLGAGIMAVFLAFCNPILSAYMGSVEPAVMSSAREYFLITAVSLPFFGVFKADCAIFRTIGDTRWIPIVSLGANMVNLIGNALAIYVFQAGAFGIGLSTAISRVAAAVFLTVILCAKKRKINIKKLYTPEFSKSEVNQIFKTAIPTSVETSLFHFGKILISHLLSTFPTGTIAAWSVYLQIAFPYVVSDAFTAAMTPVAGRCIGAGEIGQAKYYTKKLVKTAYLANFIAIGLLLLFLNPILSFYQLSPEILAQSKQFLFFDMAFFAVLQPLTYTLPNTLRAAGDLRFWAVVSAISTLGVRVGVGYLLNWAFPQLGVFCILIGWALDWVTRSICWVCRYKWGPWEKLKLTES